eukprot:Opistho-1_new@6957
MRVALAVVALAAAFACAAAAPAFDGWADEVASYSDDAQSLINYITSGKGKGTAYDRLAAFVDTYGPRLSGTPQLEAAIDFALAQLSADGFDNVHGEDVMVPHWERGHESLRILEPRVDSLALLGLGNSVATPAEGIVAEALVVSSFDELTARAAEAKGKIVVFNPDWVSYPVTVAYRAGGASAAGAVGAVAALVRSVTPYSINSPHTGSMHYQDGVPKVPVACITVEDAQLFARMQARGQRIVLELKMEAKTLPDSKSRNVVAEIVGSEHPEQVVLFSGHLDSWDVGEGAMDDGGGAFISWASLLAIKQLGLRPKRTIRLVLWTSEEYGGVGGDAYYDAHKANVSNYNIVMESDLGVFKPEGIEFTGNDAARAIMTNIGKLLAPINATEVTTDGEGTDISLFMDAGVPGASLANDNDNYFYYHHSDGDMITVLNRDYMDLCTATWAVTAYTLASLDDMLPRDKPSTMPSAPYPKRYGKH